MAPSRYGSQTELHAGGPFGFSGSAWLRLENALPIHCARSKSCSPLMAQVQDSFFKKTSLTHLPIVRPLNKHNFPLMCPSNFSKLLFWFLSSSTLYFNCLIRAFLSLLIVNLGEKRSQLIFISPLMPKKRLVPKRAFANICGINAQVLCPQSSN